MRTVLEVSDSSGHSTFVVVPKIREFFIGLGNVILVFDNGDKRTLNTNEPKELVKQLTETIETYYKNK